MGYRVNWPAVRMSLATWFDHLEVCFSYRELQFQKFCWAMKTSCPPCENDNETCFHSVLLKFLCSQSFVKSRWLWHLINIISSTYPVSWSNESSRRNLAEKPANFASCQLLYTTLFQLVSEWNSTNPTIWLVHGESKIFSSRPSQWAESIELIYFH